MSVLYLPYTMFACCFPFSSTPPSNVSINTIPVAKHAAKMIKRKAVSVVEIKKEMLAFCKVNTEGYEVEIEW